MNYDVVAMTEHVAFESEGKHHPRVRDLTCSRCRNMPEKAFKATLLVPVMNLARESSFKHSNDSISMFTGGVRQTLEGFRCHKLPRVQGRA